MSEEDPQERRIAALEAQVLKLRRLEAWMRETEERLADPLPQDTIAASAEQYQRGVHAAAIVLIRELLEDRKLSAAEKMDYLTRIPEIWPGE